MFGYTIIKKEELNALKEHNGFLAREAGFLAQEARSSFRLIEELKKQVPARDARERFKKR